MSEAAALQVPAGTPPDLLRRIETLASEYGLLVTVEVVASRLAVVVVDLDATGGVQRVADARRGDPDVVIAAYLTAPDRDRWEAAERAGADLVANRGALVRSLRRLLGEPAAGHIRRRRVALFDANEVAGRLGLVMALPDSPVGPLAVFNAGDRLVGVEDRCPHSGARLSEGDVESGVVTCPRHGSRFELSSGQRVRGPADEGIRTYDVVVADGRVWLVWL